MVGRFRRAGNNCSLDSTHREWLQLQFDLALTLITQSCFSSMKVHELSANICMLKNCQYMHVEEFSRNVTTSQQVLIGTTGTETFTPQNPFKHNLLPQVLFNTVATLHITRKTYTHAKPAHHHLCIIAGSNLC